MDILTQNIGGPKIDKNLQKRVKKKKNHYLKNEIRSIIDILKLFY